MADVIGQDSTLPADWRTVKLGQVLQRVRKPVDVEPDATYQEIGIRSHGKGVFYKEPITGAALGEKAVFWVQPDCFIVNIVFAWEQAIAKTTAGEVGMIASHRFPMYKPKEGELDLDYIVRFFKTPQGKYLLGLASPGGAGRNKTLGQEAFLDLSVPLPPYPEQLKISAILGTWDEAIALTERRIAAGQERKMGLMQRLLTGQVRFPEFSNCAERQKTKLGEMPSDWQLVRLENVATVNAESVAESADPDHEWLYIDLSAVDHGAIAAPTERRRFADLPSRARRVLHENDVIMATVRPNLLGFAFCDFAPADVLCSTGFALISAKTLSDARFIYQSLYSTMILGQISGLLTGSSYPAINSTEVKGLWFFWPQSAEERRKIAEVLAICDRELDLLARKRDALQRQKRGLMQQLLTGRVRVKGLDHGDAK